MTKALAVLALLASVALVGSVPTAAQPPKDYITVGEAKLRLGMSKAAVSKALEGHRIVQSQDSDLWMIDPDDPVAVTVQFTNGRVDVVTKEWPTKHGDVAGVIFGLVSSLQREAHPAGLALYPCIVATDTLTKPNMTIQRVWAQCGPKTVMILRFDTGGIISQGVAEVLGEHKPQ